MTSPSYISLWFFIVIIYTVIASKPASSQTPLINNICHRTTFVDFCRQVLMSDPTSASPNANLYELGLTTCNFIALNVTNSILHIQEMLTYHQSAQRFDNLQSCLQAYNTLVDCMYQLPLYFGNRRYTDAKEQARRGINKVAECEAVFREGESPLEGNNLTLRRLFTMAFVMSDIAA